MKIWIHQDDTQLGPFTLDELRRMEISADTPVWYAGLTEWMRAGDAPLTSTLFAEVEPSVTEPRHEVEAEEITAAAESQTVEPQAAESQVAEPQTATHQAWYGASRRHAVPPQVPTQAPTEKRPPNYLWLSILLTLLCCNPLAIIAIILGFKVNSRYNANDYEGAARASEQLQWLIAISIVLMLLFLPMYMIF